MNGSHLLRYARKSIVESGLSIDACNAMQKPSLLAGLGRTGGVTQKKQHLQKLPMESKVSIIPSSWEMETSFAKHHPVSSR